MKTWFSVKKRIQNKPDLIDPYRAVSYSAAKKIWKEQGRPDTWEIMEGARIKAAKTPAEWEALTGISPKATGRRVEAGRRWIAALIILALLATFMACTVPGRALAKAIYELFTSVIGNSLYIATEPDGYAIEFMPEEEYQNRTIPVDSFEDAYKNINRPLVYLKGDKYVLSSLIVGESRTRGISLKAVYHLENMEIYIKQQWPYDAPVLDTVMLTEEAINHTTNTQNDIQFFGAYTSGDSNYQGRTIIDPVIIYVNISNVLDLTAVDAILNDITGYPEQ